MRGNKFALLLSRATEVKVKHLGREMASVSALGYARVTKSDEAKFRTQPFTFSSIGSRVSRVVTFGSKS